MDKLTLCQLLIERGYGDSTRIPRYEKIGVKAVDWQKVVGELVRSDLAYMVDRRGVKTRMTIRKLANRLRRIEGM